MDFTIPEEILPDSTFSCGPSQGHSDIRVTPVSDMFFERSHRSPDISSEGLYAEASVNIKKLLHVPPDYVLIFFQGGATPAMDAAVWNFALNSVSGYRFGAFSDLWGKKMTTSLPDTVDRKYADLKEGELFPTEEVNLSADFIFLTPNETSTGVCIPDDLLALVFDGASDTSIIGWDCTSCAGGRLLPQGKYDVMVFSLQKCFGCLGGSSIMILSPKAVKKAEEALTARKIPYSLMLAGKNMAIDRAVSKSQTVNTPSTPAIWMANEAAKLMLKGGGLEAMDSLVRDHAQVMWDWVERSGYLRPYVEDEKYRSQITITLFVDDAIDAMEISRCLKATDKPNLQDGVKKYSSVNGNVIRIACFPFIDFDGTEQFEKLTRTIDFIVDKIRK